MTGVAVTNSTCLIALARIDHLELLRSLFARIVIPPEVCEEVGSVPKWIEVRVSSSKSLVEALELQVHRGEASAIALAVELDACPVILDDKRARFAARQLHLPLLGTIGVILQAKQAGFVPEVAPLFRLLHENGFYLAESLLRRALALAEEDKI